MQLHTRMTVTELRSMNPSAVELLESIGLYRPEDDADLSLGALCFRYGFNPGMLLTILQSARPALQPEPPPIDPAPYEAMGLVELVDHIESVHHQFIRAEMPRIVALAARLAAIHDEPLLATLHRKLQTFANDLDAHLRHEEASLFPMVRDLASRREVAPTPCGSAVGGPVACMENDHEQAEQALVKLRELTDSYRAPEQRSDIYRETMHRLEAFDRDLRQHMFKENALLFPRALKAQRMTGQKVVSGSPASNANNLYTARAQEA